MNRIEHNVETGEIVEIPLTEDEIQQLKNEATLVAWSSLRNQRNELLSASDWTVLADTPTNTAAWKAYRQQLRDLPANTTDPLNVVWPTPPA